MKNHQKKVIVIGISGASGSGKTYIAKKIYSELLTELTDFKIGMIMEDSYYKDQSHLDFVLRTVTNYDHPNSMEHSLLLEHITKLKNRESIKIPIYDYAAHTRKENQYIEQEACDIIILEGLLIMTNPEIRNILDLSIFVDTPLDICFIRRLLRDTKERGRNLESVVNQYYSTVRPMLMEFIEPNKKYAEIIYDNLDDNRDSINQLKQQIIDLIQK